MAKSNWDEVGINFLRIAIVFSVIVVIVNYHKLGLSKTNFSLVVLEAANMKSNMKSSFCGSRGKCSLSSYCQVQDCNHISSLALILFLSNKTQSLDLGLLPACFMCLLGYGAQLFGKHYFRHFGKCTCRYHYYYNNVKYPHNICQPCVISWRTA